MKIQYAIKIKGDVKGIGFRFWLKQRARDLDLVGFVRNQDNGNVYTLVQGTKENLDDYLDSCSEGPELAKVKKVEHEESEIDEGLENFEIMQH
ncbi:MAG: acylphosphatase [Patescibacteria group bacterium]|jgi:acylphosphatase|nr:acylphosphatase [Patescibacteria group bacterium]